MMMRDLITNFPPPFNARVLIPDAFLYCANWLAQTGDPSYCNAFNQVGAYVFHQL